MAISSRSTPEYSSRSRLQPAVAVWCLVMVSAACLLIVALYLWLSQCCFLTLFSTAALEGAEVAKHLCRGEGFASGFVTPMGLRLVPNALRHPSLFSPPLYSMLLALFFTVFGVGNTGVLLCAIALFLAQVALLFLVSERLFGIRTAVLATLLLMFNPLMLKQTETGGVMVLPALLFSLLLCMVYCAGGGGIAGIEACGAALGLCSLANPVFLVFVIPVGVYFLVTRSVSRWPNILAFLGGFLLLGGPWLIRDWVVTGSPFWGLRFLPGLVGPRQLVAFSVPSFGIRHLYSYRVALASLRSLPTYCWENLLMVLVVTAVLQPLGDYGFEKIRKLFYAAFISLWLFLGWGTRLASGRACYLIFLPFGCCVAAAYLVKLFQNFGEHRRPLYGFVMIGVLVLLPTDSWFMNPDGSSFTSGSIPAMVERFTKDEAIVTDLALPMAWCGDRHTILMPDEFYDYLEMLRTVKGIGAVYLSPELGEALENGVAESWEPVFSVAKKGGMPSNVGMRNGSAPDGFFFYGPIPPPPSSD